MIHEAARVALNLKLIKNPPCPLRVDAYEQGRPSYPLEGLHYALKELDLEDGAQRKIVDLAAGTGKLTR